MADASEPLTPEEMDRVFTVLLAPDGTLRSTALAVSGGSDSTALMVLTAEWLARTGRPASGVHVLTVDHRLRPESAAEARTVAERATALGFAHATLHWQGEKPAAALQAAARTARYRLLGAYARAHGVQAIATGHTEDDQAETVLMRLARGSGTDGLAAMPALSLLRIEAPDDAPVLLVRPLLGLPKARLRSALVARGVSWAEDPSNVVEAYERVRLRARAAALEDAGLTPPMLALSARRLRRTRTALERWTAEAMDPARGMVAMHPCGMVAVALGRLLALPEEIVIRVLANAMAIAGGSQAPVPLAGVEAIAARLATGATGAWTLARAMVSAMPPQLIVMREPGREPPRQLLLEPGRPAVWDGRFQVSSRMDVAIEVGPLGGEGLRQVRASDSADRPKGLPVEVLHALPAFRRGGELLAVPSLAAWFDAAARDRVQATFLPLLPTAGRANTDG